MDSQPTRQRFFLVFLLFFHTVNTYMDRICISSAKASMQTDIEGLNNQMMGYVFGIFAIGYALFQIPAGWFSDRAGARHALTIVVIVWSIFTALTGAVYTAASLLIVRFLFGVGEAGAYPGATRALYSWLPAKERGLGQGIFHSGARVGAAVSLVIMPLIIGKIGWRWTFVLNAAIGLVWGIVWWTWYRNDPSQHSSVNAAEVDLIRRGIESEASPSQAKIPYIQIVTSRNVLLAMFQYSASNITFFVSMTWLQPYIIETWGDKYKHLASLPLICGAIALWLSGYAVTYLHRRGMPVMSRRLPAMIGYTLGALGLLLCTQTVESQSIWPFIACFALATFGVELTLSPSWAFCMDIGGERSGAVSAAMNMVGNMGAAVSAVAFPYFVDNVSIPFFAEQTGTAASFFVFAAVMNGLAIVAWMFMNPMRELKEISSQALKTRLVLFLVLFIAVISALVFTKFLMNKSASMDHGNPHAVASGHTCEQSHHQGPRLAPSAHLSGMAAGEQPKTFDHSYPPYTIESRTNRSEPHALASGQTYEQSHHRGPRLAPSAHLSGMALAAGEQPKVVNHSYPPNTIDSRTNRSEPHALASGQTCEQSHHRGPRLAPSARAHQIPLTPYALPHSEVFA